MRHSARVIRFSITFQFSSDVDVTVPFSKSEEVDLEDLNPGIAPTCANTGPCPVSVRSCGVMNIPIRFLSFLTCLCSLGYWLFVSCPRRDKTKF